MFALDEAVKLIKAKNSNHPLVTAVDGNLGAGGSRESRTAEFDDYARYSLTGDFGAEDIVAFIVFNRQTVTGSALLEDVLCPKSSVEYGIRVDHVNADLVFTPFESSNPGQLSEGAFRG